MKINLYRVFFIVIALVSNLQDSQAGYNCIARCSCSMIDHVITADCKALNMTEIPVPQAYQVNVLLMNFNRMTRLRKDAFVMFNSLLEINLSGNRLRIIESGAFSGLERSKLRRLDLSRNSLGMLPSSDMQLIAPNLQSLLVAYNALRKFPDYLSTMTELEDFDISHNTFITSLPTNPFPSSLQSLNLSHTSIGHFSKLHFSAAQSLRVLIMSDNMASVDVDFEPKLFDPLLNVERLDLSRTFCRPLPKDSFVKLKSLTTLLLRSTYINTMPTFQVGKDQEEEVTEAVTDFPHATHLQTQNDVVTTNISSSSTPHAEYTLGPTRSPAYNTTSTNKKKSGYSWCNPKLRELDISYNSRLSIPKAIKGKGVFPSSLIKLELSYTNTRSITGKMFSNLRSVRKIRLCNSHVKTVGNDAFASLENLTSISLSGNKLRNLPKLPSSVQFINMSNLKAENLTRDCLSNLQHLTYVDWSNGKIKSVEENAFINLNRLRGIDLSNNNLNALQERTLFIKISSLLDLDLSGNRLTVIEGAAFVSHDKVQTLLLHDNQLKEITEQTLNGLISLNTLKLSHNQLINISPNAFRNLHLVKEIWLDDNELEIIFEDLFANSDKLQKLVLSGNRLLDIQPQKFPILSYLDISSNSLSSLPKIDAPLLTHYYAWENYLMKLNPETFKGLTNLVEMDIHENENLTEFSFHLFRNCQQMTMLNLGHCGVRDFVDQLMPELKVLLLGENHITEITAPLSRYLPVIQDLDLSYNDLITMNASVVNTSNTLLSIDLTGNNFRCDCSLDNLVEWIESQNQHSLVDVIGSHSYLCESPPDAFAHLVVSVVSQLDCTLPKPPQPSSESKKTFTIILCVFVAVVIATAIGVTFYCKRRGPSSSEPSSSTSPMDERSSGRSSPRLCCDWLAARLSDERRMSFGRGARNRQRVFSDDERRDLVVTSPLTSPTGLQSPEEQ
ncbi:uncharacterized protein LOC143450154 [Clavelina lepadiformis]|uniref:uncharacterized protein LOC143450154 n=1 Tax=Clavelina lepadiformis TaxID=159417 RepID=UPI004041B130